MTRPIPVNSERKRPSKSCIPCRAAKAKCTGLSEEYLHALDDPQHAAAWPGPRPTCHRCSRSGAPCDFAPSRRKGRPRRLPRSNPDPVAKQRQERSASGSGSGSGSSSGGRSPPTARRRRSPSPSTTHTSLPTPPAHTAAAAACGFLLPAAASALAQQLPPPPLAPPVPSPSSSSSSFPSIVDLAARYVSTAHVWAPFLPHSMPVLHAYLSRAPPSLPHALACLLDPSLPPPSDFAPLSRPDPAPLADIQTALLLSLYAFVLKDRTRAVDLLQWACGELLRAGWAGEDTPPGVGAHERELFVRTGWYAWGIEIHMGFIVGTRASILAHVPPPRTLDPFTLQRHVLALAQEATDYARVWALDVPLRDAHISSIVSRATSLHSYALESLSNPALSAPAQRSPLFSAALISQTATVLVLSSLSPLSPLIAPLLPCSLDTTSPPPPPGSHVRARITAAARAIVDVVRLHARTTGAPMPPLEGPPPHLGNAPAHEHAPERVHSPFFGCCLVVAARGSLLAAEDILLLHSPPSSSSSFSSPDNEAGVELAHLAADLDLCEAELRRQAAHWPASETLAAEVGLLRRTAGLV